MANMALRVIGASCLCGAAIAGFSWWSIDNKMTPLNKVVTIQAGKEISQPFFPTFFPTMGDDSTPYLVKLLFENTSNLLLDCKDIRKLNIDWAVSESQKVRSWSQLSNNSRSEGYFCKSDKNLTTAEFPLQQLKFSFSKVCMEVK